MLFFQNFFTLFKMFYEEPTPVSLNKIFYFSQILMLIVFFNENLEEVLKNICQAAPNIRVVEI